MLVDAGSGRTLTGADVLRLTGLAAARLHADGRPGRRPRAALVLALGADRARLRRRPAARRGGRAREHGVHRERARAHRRRRAPGGRGARRPGASAGRARDPHGRRRCAPTTAPDVARSSPCSTRPRPTTSRCIAFTSGTTGRPKGAMLSHGNLLAGAQALVEAWEWTPDDRLLHALPMFHMHGLGAGINGSLTAGASMVVLPRFAPPAVVEARGGVRRDHVLRGADHVRAAARRRRAARPARAAAARQRFRAAGPCALRRRRRDRRAGPGRALRHERDRHAHLEPGARRAASGFGGAAAAGRPGAAR